MAKPDGASLMDVFPEPPLHLLVTTPIAIGVFYLIYLPYFIKDRASTWSIIFAINNKINIK